MYFRAERRKQLLDVKDNFAHLVEVGPDGDIRFEFTYSISQRDMVSHGAMKVDVRVETRHVVKKTILGSSHRGFIDTKSLVNNFRSAVIDAKSAHQQHQRYVVGNKSSDFTARINNEIIPQLRAKVPVAAISHFNKPRLTLKPVSAIKSNNDPQPIMHRIANSLMVPNVSQVLSSSAGESPRALSHDMITKYGQDPTHIFSLAARVASSYVTHHGLSNPTMAPERITDAATRLLHHHLFPPVADVPPRTTEDIVDTELVHVLDTVTSDVSNINVYIDIPEPKLRLNGAPVTQLYVIFDLIDGQTGLSIDSVTKVLDLPRHLHVYRTPKIAPQVKVAGSELSSRVNLEIKQLDPGATEVEVYKKSFWVASPETDDYTLIGSYPLTSREQTLLIPVEKPHSSPALYRIIPRGAQSVQGFEFTNVAVKPARYTPTRAVSLTAHQIDTGVQLEARQIPPKVVAIQFLRWNLTTNESSYTTVGDDVGFVDQSARAADLLTTIDTNVVYNNIYAYQARLIYADGLTADFGDATIEFIKPSPGEVDTRVENLNVSHDQSPNVTFTIITQVVDTTLDAVKNMLELQGIQAYFTGDIANQRDQLKKLIAHQVHRVDLTTGHVDNFGVLTNPEFNDNALRKNQAVSPLVYGHKYRYIIYPLLRRSETLFDSIRKDAIDSITKKPYTFSPAKFLHPFTLSRGVIVSSRGISLRQAKEPMAHGIIGSIANVEVSFDHETALVTDATASNFDRYLNVVTWRVLGNPFQVDHFLVMKQVHGVRTMLGKTHSEFVNGSCQFVHQISKHDVGSIQYVITPVYNDYQVGAPVVTNTIIIEET